MVIQRHGKEKERMLGIPSPFVLVSLLRKNNNKHASASFLFLDCHPSPRRGESDHDHPKDDNLGIPSPHKHASASFLFLDCHPSPYKNYVFFSKGESYHASIPLRGKKRLIVTLRYAQPVSLAAHTKTTWCSLTFLFKLRFC